MELAVPRGLDQHPARQGVRDHEVERPCVDDQLGDVLVEEVGDALREVRAVSCELRPPFLDRLPLLDAVRLQCSETAQRAGVGTLVLTHQVPSPAPGSEPEWVAQAAEAFDGEIVFGNDLTVVTVG